MELHGSPWSSIEFHGIPWSSMGFPWMIHYGGPMEFYGGSMEFHGDSMELHGLPWNILRTPIGGINISCKVIMHGQCQFHKKSKEVDDCITY